MAALTAKIRQHAGERDVQSAALKAIAALGETVCGRPRAPPACPADVFDTIATAMRAHPKDYELQLHGFSALTVLAAPGGVVTKGHAGRSGALEAAVSAITDREGVNSYAALRFIWTCCVEPSPPANKQRAFQAGAVQAACTFASIFVEIPTAAGDAASAGNKLNAIMALQMALATVQTITCDLDAAKTAAGAAGMMQTAAAVLALPTPSSHGNTAALALVSCREAACGILWNCCYDSDGVTNARLAGEAGAAEGVLALARQSGQNPHLLNSIFGAMKGMTYKEARSGDLSLSLKWPSLAQWPRRQQKRK